jgi:hypothetical protein
MTVWVLVVIMNVAGVPAPVRAYVGVYEDLAACERMVQNNHDKSVVCIEERVISSRLKPQ